MIGNLLSGAVRVITAPIDVSEIAADVLVGGNGDRSELSDLCVLPSELRDDFCETLED
jgi:hypothetical protein